MPISAVYSADERVVVPIKRRNARVETTQPQPRCRYFGQEIGRLFTEDRAAPPQNRDQVVWKADKQQVEREIKKSGVEA